jgi:hypothetical protein
MCLMWISVLKCICAWVGIEAVIVILQFIIVYLYSVTQLKSFKMLLIVLSINVYLCFKENVCAWVGIKAVIVNMQFIIAYLYSVTQLKCFKMHLSSLSVNMN